MSDTDVKLLLREKNIEITKNKMVLDIENNIDSLKKNIENIINLEIFNIEKLLETNYEIINDILIRDMKVESMKYFNRQLEEIVLLSREFIYKETLNKNFNMNYEKHFYSLNSIFEDHFNDLLSTLQHLVKKNIKNLQQEESIYEFLIKKYNEKILQKVNVQFKERTNIILNNAKETYNKYLLLNKTTN